VPVVPDGALDAEDADAAVVHQPAVDVFAAAGRLAAEVAVVVATHVQHAGVETIGEVGQVVGLQVAAGQDQVDVAPAVGVEMLSESAAFLVGDGEDLHLSSIARGGGPRTVGLMLSATRGCEGRPDGWR